MANVTGLSVLFTDLARKRLELLREILPGLRRLAILTNTGNSGAMLEAREIEATARTLGLEAVTPDVQRAEDIAAALESLKDRVEALYVIADPLITTSRIRINTLALRARKEVTVHGMIATTLSQPVENPRLLRFDAAFRKTARFEHPRHSAAEGDAGTCQRL